MRPHNSPSIGSQALEWPAARVIHLLGGCRATHGFDPNVTLFPPTIDGKDASFISKGFRSLYSEIESLKLKLIGVDFYTHVLALEGHIPPEWRPFHRQRQSLWPATEAMQIYQRIGHGAFKRDNGALWDLASRVAYQLEIVSWRLREVSEAYHATLKAQIGRRAFRAGCEFEDGFMGLVYFALQSFLIDACILRDYLAELGVVVLSGRHGNASVRERITTMSGLRKHLTSEINEPRLIVQELKKATAPDGWITLLGNYRNLIMHSAPLERAEKRLFALCGSLNIDAGRSIPAIYCPIPEDPLRIQKARSTGKQFEGFESQFDLFASRNIPRVDGMDYAHAVLRNLAILAQQLATLSPIPPEFMVFTEADIVGFVEEHYHWPRDQGQPPR